nr:glycoside hydrolase family 13 protein [Planosporangium thailandense]
MAGIAARLPYLSALGVDAVWFSPWYPSPMADAGYDVTDYRDIDPAFGTLAGAEELIARAHALDLRVIVDMVPNHCSDQHPWFREAVAAGPGSAARELFWFRDGRGPDGELPPNNWQSIFGGPAWTRVADAPSGPQREAARPRRGVGQWYLHLFAPEQPDVNWANPKVREEFEDILRFWFDRGVDGVRIDSASVLAKDPQLADFDPAAPPSPHPYSDRDEVHDIYRSWRAVADSYPRQRALIGEVWLPDPARFARYLSPGELHTAFNFDFLGCAWDGEALRRCIDATLATHAPVDAPATWVLANHDVTRTVTRYGRADTTFDHVTRRLRHGSPSDLTLGTRRARAAALLSLALPGSVYLYQGEELGLWEVEDVPDELRQDPIFRRTGGADRGRDGCRVPLPWSGSNPPFGFSPDGATGRPWLPQPDAWRDLTAQRQDGASGSMLELYRAALRLRRQLPGPGDGELRWLDSSPEALAFACGDAFACVVNLSDEVLRLPRHRAVLLASGELDGDRLPSDTTVWLRLP